MTNRFTDRSFGNNDAVPAEGSTGNKKVDWTELNKHIAEACHDAVGVEEGSPENVIAYISGVVDLGIHQDAEVEEQYQQVGADNEKSNKFRAGLVKKGTGELFTTNVNGQEVEMIRYTPKPAREVAYFVDFPEITVDKGQFFGDSNPAPYRIHWGGVFQGIPSSRKVTGYPKDGKWMCGNGSFHTKLAKACGINTKDGFAQDDILSLIGKPISVQLEVFVNDKGFLQEKVSNPAKPARGLAIPEYNQDLCFYVGMFDAQNTDQDLKFLPKAVKEYIKQASNYEGSVLQKQLEALEGEAPKQESKPAEKKPAPPKAQPKTQVVDSSEEEYDTDVPF